MDSIDMKTLQDFQRIFAIPYVINIFVFFTHKEVKISTESSEVSKIMTTIIVNMERKWKKR